MPLSRRQFLKHSGATALSGHAAASRAALAADAPVQGPIAGDPAARLPAVPFEGKHQAGIVDRPPPAACFAAFDLIAVSRHELAELLHTLTRRARFLTAGGAPPNLGTGAPPSDSGTLGPVIPADGLTVTVGLGAGLFERDRYGLHEHRPRHLKQMVSFPNDNLDPTQTGGDLLLQICAGSSDTAIHALRDIAKHTRGAMQLRWRVDGFIAPRRPAGVPRNHLGFEDGIANPDVTDPAVAQRLLWANAASGEPAWAHGGTYHVIRIIKMIVEFWDRVSLDEQQQMIGRYRASGAPLDGSSVDDIPDYHRDPHGRRIPFSAHIRLANPRTSATDDSRILRRGYNYDRGVDISGNLDMGLVFNCFQQDIARQFEATQTRLIGEPMVDYVSPVGGGYFFAPPGVRDKRDWYARRLFSA